MNAALLPAHEEIFVRHTHAASTQLIRAQQETARAHQVALELATLDPAAKTLRVLAEPLCATAPFVYHLMDDVRDALLAGRRDALELAHLAVLAARRTFGPPSTRASRLGLIVEALAVEVEAELAFGSRNQAGHLLWEAAALMNGFDGEPLGTIEFYLARALSEVTPRLAPDAFDFLSLARKLARSIQDPALEAQLELVTARLYELRGEFDQAAAWFSSAAQRWPDPLPESHWLQVLNLVHLRAVPLAAAEVAG